jgi:hypothetical protein
LTTNIKLAKPSLKITCIGASYRKVPDGLTSDNSLEKVLKKTQLANKVNFCSSQRANASSTNVGIEVFDFGRHLVASRYFLVKR